MRTAQKSGRKGFDHQNVKKPIGQFNQGEKLANQDENDDDKLRSNYIDSVRSKQEILQLILQPGTSKSIVQSNKENTQRVLPIIPQSNNPPSLNSDSSSSFFQHALTLQDQIKEILSSKSKRTKAILASMEDDSLEDIQTIDELSRESSFGATNRTLQDNADQLEDDDIEIEETKQVPQSQNENNKSSTIMQTNDSLITSNSKRTNFSSQASKRSSKKQMNIPSRLSVGNSITIEQVHQQQAPIKSSIQLTYEHVLDMKYNNKKPPRTTTQTDISSEKSPNSINRITSPKQQTQNMFTRVSPRIQTYSQTSVATLASAAAQAFKPQSNINNQQSQQINNDEIKQSLNNNVSYGHINDVNEQLQQNQIVMNQQSLLQTEPSQDRLYCVAGTNSQANYPSQTTNGGNHPKTMKRSSSARQVAISQNESTGGFNAATHLASEVQNSNIFPTQRIPKKPSQNQPASLSLQISPSHQPNKSVESASTNYPTSKKSSSYIGSPLSQMGIGSHGIISSSSSATSPTNLAMYSLMHHSVTTSNMNLRQQIDSKIIKGKDIESLNITDRTQLNAPPRQLMTPNHASSSSFTIAVERQRTQDALLSLRGGSLPKPSYESLVQSALMRQNFFNPTGVIVPNSAAIATTTLAEGGQNGKQYIGSNDLENEKPNINVQGEISNIRRRPPSAGPTTRQTRTDSQQNNDSLKKNEFPQKTLTRHSSERIISPIISPNTANNVQNSKDSHTPQVFYKPPKFPQSAKREGSSKSIQSMQVTSNIISSFMQATAAAAAVATSMPLIDNKPVPTEMNIIERNNEWLLQRKQKIEQKQIEIEKLEIQECTFKPKIRNKSPTPHAKVSTPIQGTPSGYSNRITSTPVLQSPQFAPQNQQKQLSAGQSSSHNKPHSMYMNYFNSPTLSIPHQAQTSRLTVESYSMQHSMLRKSSFGQSTQQIIQQNQSPQSIFPFNNSSSPYQL